MFCHHMEYGSNTIDCVRRGNLILLETGVEVVQYCKNYTLGHFSAV